MFYKEIESKIIINLMGAKSSVKIALAWFTNPTLYNLILELKLNKVHVELILSDDKINYKNNKVDFQRLIDEHIELRISNFPNLMHNKFCIVDDRILINGSYNWTLKAEKINFENIVISTDRKLVNDFNEYFSYLKLNTSKVSKVNKVNFRDYGSLDEIAAEFDLIENETEVKEIIIEPDSENEYTLEIQNQIDEAYILYLNAKNKECVEYCKDFINRNSGIKEIYTIISNAYWRLSKYNELIENANKIIELDGEDYDAYNLLGIGYSYRKGGEQKSIENFEICIKKYPSEDAYYRNRALSYNDLSDEINLPDKFRKNYKAKADKDWYKIIEIVNNLHENELTYSNLFSKAYANYFLNRLKHAKADIVLAIKMYNDEKDIFLKDKNVLKEMKRLLKDLKNE